MNKNVPNGAVTVPLLCVEAAKSLDVIAIVEPFMPAIDLTRPEWADLRQVIEASKQQSAPATPAPRSAG